MSDDPTQPPRPDLTKRPGAEHPGPGAQPDPAAAEPASIWQPLDGSTPKPAVAPSTFTRPGAGAIGAAQAARAAPAPFDPAGRAVYTLAGWGPRFGAFLLDNILFSVVILCFTVPVGVGLGMTLSESVTFFTGGSELPETITDTTTPWVVIAIGWLIQLSLPAVFLLRWNGQTPGKRVAGLRVVRADGEPLTAGVALKREFLGKGVLLVIVAILTLFLAFLANYLWPLWDRENRAGHDMFAKTRVVVAR